LVGSLVFEGEFPTICGLDLILMDLWFVLVWMI